MTILRSAFTGRVIRISTDYVFDGEKGAYSEPAETNPIGWYGRSKLVSENLILGANRANDTIVRTTVLYGSKQKPDFVTKILTEYDKVEPFGVPYNMTGSPTYIPHLAEALLKLCQLEKAPKIVNIAGEDVISRYEFAIMIGNIFGKHVDLVYGTRAKKDFRPLKAGLKTNLARKLGLPIYSAVDGLLAMKEKMEVMA